MYAVFLARSVNPGSIPGYLNIVRLMHEKSGLSNPIDNWELRAVRRGIQRSLGRPPKQKLPISIDILHLLFNNLDLHIPQQQAFWTACLVAFFAFLRKSTLLPKSGNGCDRIKALCLGDVHLPDRSLFYLHIRHSKTIQFGQRQLTIPIAAVQDSNLCPVTAMINMLSDVKSQNLPKLAPLFSFVNPDGSLGHLTHSSFVKTLKATLSAAGMDPSVFSGHSFRRGGCSYAFKLGLSPLLIKLRGDWKSNAFERYVNIEDTHHLLVAKKLSTSVV